MTLAFIPPTGTLVPVWPGTPPGSEMWTWTEQELLIDGDRMVRNVSVPTLEVFAPTGEPNGTAVIVAPGGAYQLLMVDHEGTDLARWLAARGVAAFVLRYRIAHTPEDDGEMVRFRRELDSTSARRRGAPAGSRSSGRKLSAPRPSGTRTAARQFASSVRVQTSGASTPRASVSLASRRARG